jgi:hypothetical protein
VGVDIARSVLFDASGLNLLETPLRQVDVASAKVTSKLSVLQTERSDQCPHLRVVPGRSIIDDLDLPVVLGVSDCEVAVARNFPVSLGDRSGDLVRVKVATGLSVDETNDIAVADVSDLGVLCVVVGLLSVGVEEPVVVGVLVVVASNLLLGRAFGVCLNVGVQESTAVTHVLQRGTGTNGDFKRAVLANFSTPKVGLEERRHLSIARTAVLENEEVDVEREHVDDKRDHNQSNDPEDEVCSKIDLSNC